MRKPVSSNVPVTQSFSWRHNGVDFSGRFDRTVYAPEKGTVLYQRQVVGGNVIRFISANGEHRLAHLSKYLVKNGAKVSTGAKIGIMGNTGLAFGVHLHWGFLKNGKYVNPLSYLKKPSTAVYYTVKSGDTVARICAKYGITLAQFKRLNPQISDINKIYPGQKVRVR